MAHTHAVIDANACFVIDPYTRRISCKSATRKEIMQGDHKSEQITFLVPRMIEGHDLSQCNSIYVHYDNISANKKLISSGLYEVVDIAEDINDSDYLKFSWLIYGDATQNAGTLEFSITFSCIEGGKSEFVWSAGATSLIEVLPCKQNSQNVTNSNVSIIEKMNVQLNMLEQQIESLNDRLNAIGG